MYREIVLRYVHPVLNLGMQDIKTVWLLGNEPVQLITTLHQGNLVYRIPGSRKRISYRMLKKGLIKKELIVRLPFQLLPF